MGIAVGLSQVSKPYAEALLGLAKSNDLLTETNNDMTIVSSFLVNSSELTKFLKNPLITGNSKKNAIKDIFGEYISLSTLNFIFFLVDRSRIEVLESIAEKYLELYLVEESIVIAKITSAIELSAEQQMKISQIIKQITSFKQVKLALKVEPRLIGGFTIEIGSLFIDTSLRGQLRQISSFLID